MNIDEKIEWPPAAAAALEIYIYRDERDYG